MQFVALKRELFKLFKLMDDPKTVVCQLFEPCNYVVKRKYLNHWWWRELLSFVCVCPKKEYLDLSVCSQSLSVGRADPPSNILSQTEKEQIQKSPFLPVWLVSLGRSKIPTFVKMSKIKRFPVVVETDSIQIRGKPLKKKSVSLWGGCCDKRTFNRDKVCLPCFSSCGSLARNLHGSPTEGAKRWRCVIKGCWN